jgi:hypothetical protein
MNLAPVVKRPTNELPKPWHGISHNVFIFFIAEKNLDRLCGLVVSVEDYKHRGPGFDSRALLRIFLMELGLERGPLSLVIR